MAIQKIREHRMNSGGTYDTIHRETEAELVSVSDSNSHFISDNVEGVIDEIGVAMGNRIEKVDSAVSGNIATFTPDGSLSDGGISMSVVNGILRITYDNGI